MIPKEEVVPYLQRLVSEIHQVPIKIIEKQKSELPKPIRVCDAAKTEERRERARLQWAAVRAQGKTRL